MSLKPSIESTISFVPVPLLYFEKEYIFEDYYSDEALKNYIKSLEQNILAQKQNALNEHLYSVMEKKAKYISKLKSYYRQTDESGLTYAFAFIWDISLITK
ncbi:MAG TPA: hypothetical protein ENO30_02105 [Thermodesulfobium narugense]|nr:hypothetical protein [Thermodesulfobium narugense]